MASDPRYTQTNFLPFRVKNCGLTKQAAIDDSIDRSNSLAGQLGKIGDLEIWNVLGGKSGGKIGEGLRTLAKVSNSIRGGNGAQPTMIGSGVDWVFEHLGLNSTDIDIAKSLNPGIANTALGQAKSMYEKIKQGNFRITDVPGVFSDMQELERLIGGIITPTQGPGTSSGIFEQCGASPYAMDLFRFAPKYKFLFIVQFEYTNPYMRLGLNKLAFVVKTSTRPQIDFEMEDINKYNFHTKVKKKTVYNPMTMTFLDDDQNQAMMFMNSYLKAYSPIANVNDPHITNAYEEHTLELNGKNRGKIYPGEINTDVSASSLGLLLNNSKTVLSKVTLFHLYRQGQLMNVYEFYNPRISKLNLDDLDMNGDCNEFTMDFSYDGLFMIPGFKTNPNAIRGSGKNWNLEDISGMGVATYPIAMRGRNADDHNVKDLYGVTGQEYLSQLGKQGTSGQQGLLSKVGEGFSSAVNGVNWGNTFTPTSNVGIPVVDSVIRDANVISGQINKTANGVVNLTQSFKNTFSTAFGGSDWAPNLF